jgi:DNA-binding beta-propeller fold protein YncE
MATLKRAIIAISLLLVTMIVAPAVCAQDIALANPIPASDTPVIQTPSDIAVDTAGNIYVTDNWADRVWKFSPSGDVITYWGSKGSGEGQFSVPAHIAIDSQGFIYITDINNNRIQKFSSDGRYISHWDFLARGLIECSPIGSYPRECWGESHSLGGIATGPDGNLYIVDSSNNSIHRTTPDGKYLAKWGFEGTGKGQFNNPSAIAFDREGNFFVTDTANNRVQKFSANGTFLTSWGSKGSANGQFFHPSGIGVDRMGFVYVIDSTLNCVQKFSGSGTFVTRWGTKGTKDGEFALPLDVAVDGNDNVYVTDFSNHRVQVFTSDGSFITKWGGSPVPPSIAPIILPTITVDPKQTPSLERDDGISLNNITEYLSNINKIQYWGFSSDQISKFSEKMEKNVLGNYRERNCTYYCIHIANFTKFSEDLRDTIGISDEQQIALLYYNQKEMRYRIAYYEIPGFKAPETPHHSVSGKVADAEGLPVSGAIVRFESNLTFESIPLSATNVTGPDGTYHITLAWGNQQNATITKEGYSPYVQTEIILQNESNVMDFQLTRKPISTPGFTSPLGISAVVVGCLIFIRKRSEM